MRSYRLRPELSAQARPSLMAGPGAYSVTGFAIATRDPALWPFGTYSVWNYPLGSNATYSNSAAPGGISIGQWLHNYYGSSNLYLHSDNSNPGIYISQSSDTSQITSPQAETEYSTQFGTLQFNRLMPSGAPSSPSLVTGHYGNGWGTPGGCAAPCQDTQLCVVSLDHLTGIEIYCPIYFSSNPGTLPLTGGTVVWYGAGWYGGSGCMDVDLKGPGHSWYNDISVFYTSGEEDTPSAGVANGTAIAGGSMIRAAQTSSYAGLIRHNEFANGIPHAMNLAVPGAMLNKNAPNSRNFVYPATRADGNTSGYATTGSIYMGSTLAIPLSVNLNSYTWNTTGGKMMALAAQQFGFIIGDTGSGPLLDWFYRSEDPSNQDSTGFFNDEVQIWNLLQVVTNATDSNGNPPATGYRINGGDGTLSAPIAPPFGAAYGGGDGRRS